MNDRHDKQARELAAMEHELAQGLRPLLTRAAQDGLDLFSHELNLPDTLAKHPSWNANTERFHLARQCLNARQALQMPESGLAAAYLACCEERHSADPQRRGPHKLAQWLLGQLPEA